MEDNNNLRYLPRYITIAGELPMNTCREQDALFICAMRYRYGMQPSPIASRHARDTLIVRWQRINQDAPLERQYFIQQALSQASVHHCCPQTA